jgi:preprotein translocase subunit SecD
MILLTICLGQGSVFSQAPQRRIRVEFRWAEASPGKGLTQARVPKTGESIYLHREALIRNEDIIKADALEDPNTNGGYRVALVFTKHAAERMARATQQRSGKRLAVLVDGKVISAPFLSGGIYDKALITGEITKVEAERIASELNRASRQRTQ